MITHETNQRKVIADSIEVYSGYAKQLADNGISGDKCLALMIAPAIGGFDEYLYLDGNGDPVLVGWLADGEFVASDNWVEDCDSPEYDWAATVINAEFLP